MSRRLMAKMLSAMLRALAQPLLNGIMWSLGAGMTEAIIKNYGKGIVRFMRSKLLFHPKITFVAGLTAFASFCTLVAGLSKPLHALLGPHADQIVAGAEVVGPIMLFIATYGRSPASAVDNNRIPT